MGGRAKTGVEKKKVNIKKGQTRPDQNTKNLCPAGFRSSFRSFSDYGNHNNATDDNKFVFNF